MNGQVYKYAIEYYLALKSKNILIHATTKMNSEDNAK